VRDRLCLADKSRNQESHSTRASNSPTVTPSTGCTHSGAISASGSTQTVSRPLQDAATSTPPPQHPIPIQQKIEIDHSRPFCYSPLHHSISSPIPPHRPLHSTSTPAALTPSRAPMPHSKTVAAPDTPPAPCHRTTRLAPLQPPQSVALPPEGSPRGRRTSTPGSTLAQLPPGHSSGNRPNHCPRVYGTHHTHHHDSPRIHHNFTTI
jgi:hypothetical protein